MVEALSLSDFKPEEMICVIKKIFSPQGRRTPMEEFFPQMFEILETLQETGFEKAEIEVFLDQLHRRDGEWDFQPHVERFALLPSSLRDLRETGLSKEVLSSLVLELITVIPRDPEKAGLKQMPKLANLLADSGYDDE